MKINFVKFTLKQLIISGSHLGYNKNFYKGEVKPYLLGRKNNIDIFNIKYTGLQLKILIQYIINIVSLRQKILLFNTNSFLKCDFFFKLKNIIYKTTKWNGGTLTNFKINRRKYLKQNKNDPIKHLAFMPSLVIAPNSKDDNIAFAEATALEIPSSGVLDTDSLKKNFVNYPIYGNAKSLDFLYFYNFLVYQAIIKGKQKEKIKIIKII